LVLPLDTTALWRWAIRKQQTMQSPVIFDAHVPPVLPNPMDSHDKSLQIN
jgi:hypothetical protein